MESPVSVVLRCPDSPTIHRGEATFYNATGAGACSFDSSKTDLMVGAMNQFEYAGSQICGATVSVTGPSGTVVIRVVDLCPGCADGSIDLSPEAFAQIADTSLGRVPITWYIVENNVNGPILYHFMPASSQYWTAVQIRNHRYPIYSLEYLSSPGKFTMVDRTGYNYFVQPNGMGSGPYIFRVTDIYGHVVVDSAIAMMPGQDVPGHAQFQECSP